MPWWLQPIIAVITSLTYFFFTGLLFYKHGANIQKVNKFLLINWIIERCFYLILVSTKEIKELGFERLTKIIMSPWFSFSYFILSNLNYLVLYFTLFRLKIMQVYMDPKSKSEAMIKAKLLRLQLFRIVATIVIGSMLAYGVTMTIISREEDPMNMFTIEYSRQKLIFESIVFAVTFCV